MAWLTYCANPPVTNSFYSRGEGGHPPNLGDGGDARGPNVGATDLGGGGGGAATATAAVDRGSCLFWSSSFTSTPGFGWVPTPAPLGQMSPPNWCRQREPLPTAGPKAVGSPASLKQSVSPQFGSY